MKARERLRTRAFCGWSESGVKLVQVGVEVDGLAFSTRRVVGSERIIYIYM